MPHDKDLSPSKETPIERIFHKVMHRKMTSFERICFHLKRRIKPPPRDDMSESSSSSEHSHRMTRT
jgi:hypothetical protein